MRAQPSIAHYHLTAKLGQGGMGEVWRATDTKLDREVAIKVLPESFADDPERMARFKREAKVLASLNHPNIAQIYGIEDGALVMELIEGETLHGPLPVETALAYARQIADAAFASICGTDGITPPQSARSAHNLQLTAVFSPNTHTFN